MPKKPTKAKPKKLARKELPLDDHRWLLVGEVHKLLAQRIGNKNLAAVDLTEAMGKVRCMRRSARSGVRELVPASLWRDHQFESWNHGLLVISRPPSLPAGQLVILKRQPMSLRQVTHNSFFIAEVRVAEIGKTHSTRAAAIP